MARIETGALSDEPFERVDLAEGGAGDLASRVTALRASGQYTDEQLLDALTGKDAGGADVLSDADQVEVDRLLAEWEQRRGGGRA